MQQRFHPLAQALHQADALRQSQGRLLDAIGLGPLPTSSRIALRLPGLQLRAYGGDPAGPVLLIVPAPIKRAYIWDLAPGISVVERCRRHGLTVYLVEWTEAAGATLGLADYADRMLLAAVDAILRETGHPRILLAGHSLGGTLAAIFAALHPERIRGLVLLEAPTKFGADAGPFAPLVALSPVGPISEALGSVPGSFLDLVSVAASPASFLASRWLDRLASADDKLAFATLLRVERWTLDELPLPGRFFAEVVERLYREDRFLAGTLTLSGCPAAPAGLAMPLLLVMRPASLIIPPRSVLPLFDAVPSRCKQVLRYDGDRGVALQHVGVLVGQTAHHRVWPKILRWIDKCPFKSPLGCHRG